MKTKTTIIKLFGIIALIAVIEFSMAACGGDEEDPQLKITVTGLEQYNGKFAWLLLQQDATKDAPTLAYATGTISSGSLTLNMLYWEGEKEDKPYSETGTYYVALQIYESSPNNNSLLNKGITSKSIGETTSIALSEFTVGD